MLIFAVKMVENLMPEDVNESIMTIGEFLGNNWRILGNKVKF